MMEKFLGQDIPEKQRAEFLENNCDAVENLGYTRRFYPEELNQKKEQLANASIQINDIEEEKSVVMADFKERLKPLNEEKKELLEQLKNKSEFVNEKCYKFIFHEEKIVGYYNSLGELVSSRPIMPQEMQKSFYSLHRSTGTDNE